MGQAALFAVAAVAVLLAGVAYLFNGLVRRRNRVDATWSDVEVLLERRHDLVPNLVSAAGAAETQLTPGVRSLFAVAGAYPQLKASAAFIDLQRKLTETEDGLEHARQFYNYAVSGYTAAAPAAVKA